MIIYIWIRTHPNQKENAENPIDKIVIKTVTVDRPIEASTNLSGTWLMLFKGREILKEELGAPALPLTSLQVWQVTSHPQTISSPRKRRFIGIQWGSAHRSRWFCAWCFLGSSFQLLKKNCEPKCSFLLFTLFISSFSSGMRMNDHSITHHM